MPTNRELFRARYEQELRAQRPQDTTGAYSWSIERLPEICDLMVAGLAKGSANKDSPAIKRTCKALGVKHTYAGIQEFLSRQQAQSKEKSYDN